MFRSIELTLVIHITLPKHNKYVGKNKNSTPNNCTCKKSTPKKFTENYKYPQKKNSTKTTKITAE